jgi:hypothetical protein
MERSGMRGSTAMDVRRRLGRLDSKMVVMAPNMPDDVKKMAMDTEAAIASGKLDPFKCPVGAHDGTRSSRQERAGV